MLAMMSPLFSRFAAVFDGGDEAPLANRLHVPPVLEARGPRRRQEERVRVLEGEQRPRDRRETLPDRFRLLDLLVGRREGGVQIDAVVGGVIVELVDVLPGDLEYHPRPFSLEAVELR